MILLLFQYNSVIKSTSYQNYMWRNCLCKKRTEEPKISLRSADHVTGRIILTNTIIERFSVANGKLIDNEI